MFCVCEENAVTRAILKAAVCPECFKSHFIPAEQSDSEQKSETKDNALVCFVSI